jgi:hypothetical protein
MLVACGGETSTSCGCRPSRWLGWWSNAPVSLAGAVAAHSPALLAFGSDSFVELLSAVIVLLQFLPSFPLNKTTCCADQRAFSFSCWPPWLRCPQLLALVRGVRPETSFAGIGITAAALIGMPILARKKRAAARAANNRCLGRGCRTVSHVRLSCCRHLARLGLQRCLSSFVGRFGCGFGGHTDTRRRGAPSYAG